MISQVLGYTGPMPTANTLLQNVSLSTIAPYNPANSQLSIDYGS